MNPTNEQLQRIGETVCEIAYCIFADCGESEDFCIQNAGSTSAVFGGTNRLIWTPLKGFYPDRSYCRPGFLSAWDASAYTRGEMP